VECVIVLFFFFQAEDGIRDFHVTGVQTCALPRATLVVTTLIIVSDLCSDKKSPGDKKWAPTRSGPMVAGAADGSVTAPRDLEGQSPTTSVKLSSPTTRRLRARPSSVLLSAMGRLSP